MIMYQLLSNYKYPFGDQIGNQKQFIKSIVYEKIPLDHIKCTEGSLNSEIAFIQVTR